MRLYDYSASANCLKPRILLAQLGLPYERVPVDIFAGESTTPAYRAKNPAGRTPVLELDSGETIAESNAILLFLGEGTPFVPDELAERARVSSSASATPSPTSRSTPTRTWRARPGSTWAPTRPWARGSAASRRRPGS
jgi:glutathione S-transferase